MIEDFEQAKTFIKSKIADFLLIEYGIKPSISLGHKPFKCVLSNHKDAKPSMQLAPNNDAVICHANEHDKQNFDLFELIQDKFGIDSFADQFKKAVEILNLETTIDLDKIFHQKQVKFQSLTDTDKQKIKTEKDRAENIQKLIRTSNQILIDNFADLEQLDAWKQKRGYSLETCKHFNLGICKDFCFKDYQSGNDVKTKMNALIIPKGQGFFTARSLPKDTKLFFKPSGMQNIVFNFDNAVNSEQDLVLIVESETDAIAIYDASGIEAIGLGGATNSNKLIELLKEKPIKKGFVVIPDQDSTGQNSANDLIEQLKSNGYFAEISNIPECKDANELLCKSKDTLHRYLEKTLADARKHLADIKHQDQIKTSLSTEIDDFLQIFKTRAKQPKIATGFKKLDEVFQGGFIPGLYLIGAESSSGKTTFCLQILQHIAKHNTEIDCLFFSLEMPKEFIFAKLLSSLIYQIENSKDIPFADFYFDSGEILNNDFESKDKPIKENFDEALNYFRTFAERIFIFDGLMSARAIKDKVKQHRIRTGRNCIVFVDYIQLIAPDNLAKLQNDKMNIDLNINLIKSIANEYKLPVICISSVNRASYDEPITKGSLKESGNLEFQSEVILGLQPKGIDFEPDETKDARKIRLRNLMKQNNRNGKQGLAYPVELCVLKNRNGYRSKIDLQFCPKYNTFLEAPEFEQEQDQEDCPF